MTDEQLKKLQETIDSQLKAGIETHVNGKIKALTQKLDEYIKADELWKEKAEPVLQMGENMKGFGRVSLYLIGFASAVIGLVYLIFNVLKK